MLKQKFNLIRAKETPDFFLKFKNKKATCQKCLFEINCKDNTHLREYCYNSKSKVFATAELRDLSVGEERERALAPVVNSL